MYFFTKSLNFKNSFHGNQVWLKDVIQTISWYLVGNWLFFHHTQPVIWQTSLLGRVFANFDQIWELLDGCYGNMIWLHHLFMIFYQSRRFSVASQHTSKVSCMKSYNFMCYGTFFTKSGNFKNSFHGNWARFEGVNQVISWHLDW